MSARAEEPEIIEMLATGYCDGTTCADGSKVHKGVCAVAPERIGQTAIIYTADGSEVLGIMECRDTGGQTIRSGKVIDVYFPTMEEVNEFAKRVYAADETKKGRVRVQFLYAEG